MDGWQPFATAPKDGTQILVALSDNDGGRYAVIRWNTGDATWIETTLCLTVHYGSDDEPTHWMKLPALPEKR